MNIHVRKLLSGWLDNLALGIVLSTAFTCGLIVEDVSGFASITTNIDGGVIVRVTVWLLLITAMTPLVAATDALLTRRGR